jgi:hypothetical protein
MDNKKLSMSIKNLLKEASNGAVRRNVNNIQTKKNFKDKETGDKYSIIYHGLENTKGGEKIVNGVYEILRSADKIGEVTYEDLCKLVKQSMIRYKREY